MKKQLFFLCIMVIGMLSSNAQSIQLLDTTGAQGGIGSTAQATYNYMVDTNTTLDVMFNVKNITSSAISVKLKKYLIANADTDNVTFCIGVNCYPATTTLSAAISIPANSLMGSGAFLTDFTAKNSPNTAQVMYTIFNTANLNDSVSVTINYNVSATAGIKQLTTNYYVSDIVPNPASSTVSFAYDLNNTSQLASVKIYNMLGSLVKTVPLETYTSNTKIDINSLEEGFYVYSVIVGGKVIKTSRLVVSR